MRAMQVVSVVEGLFFKAKIAAAVQSKFCNTVAEVKEEQPKLIIVDLEHPAAHELLKTYGEKVIAFGPHMRTELLAIAKTYGARVYPRSVFFNDIHKLVREYA